MSKKKNIDDFFKEGFKSFNATPSPHVWNNIQAKLEEKEDRKIIPLWLKLSGVAALLALLLTIGNSVFDLPFNNNSITPTITEENSKKEILESNATENSKSELTSQDPEGSFQNNTEKTKLKESTIKPNSEIVYEKNSKSETKINKSINQNLKDPKESNVNTAVAKNEANDKTIKESFTQNDFKEERYINTEKDISINKEAVATEEVNPKNINNNKPENVSLEEENKRSIFDAIEETNEEETVALNENNKPDHHWEITPNVGPVYYNTLSEGSSIDPSFSDNTKSGDLNIAYGVQVSYNLNNRLSVRSGFSNVNLSYATTGIELGNGPVASALKSINYNKSDNVLITVDKGRLANQNPEGEFGYITPKSTSGEPTLNQELSYYEVPLELKYAVLNKKFGVNLIGGFSTLFLGENELIVDAGDFSETLGEANNLSSVSFTTNIGLGLNYSFSKKLMFNIEPMFKYQLNPYTDSSVDFKPYYVGIYTGLSFKF